MKRSNIDLFISTYTRSSAFDLPHARLQARCDGRCEQKWRIMFQKQEDASQNDAEVQKWLLGQIK